MEIMVLIKLVCPTLYTDRSSAHPSANQQFTLLKECKWKKKDTLSTLLNMWNLNQANVNVNASS